VIWHNSCIKQLKPWNRPAFSKICLILSNRDFPSVLYLRDYQRRAFQYFITYFENENLRKNKQIHTLFHMATGSGKTVIMAGLILYLYTKGYRKFLFFVNQTNILEKTKENFLNPASGKYLFADNVEILGEQIAIREVDNFPSLTNRQLISALLLRKSFTWT
jgi:type I site-specific restriction endonuclease